VCAVVVSHDPDWRLLGELLDSLGSQVERTVVVDNATAGTQLDRLCQDHPNVDLLSLPENRGLAEALNAGIARARAMPRISRVLLMDQDSVPAADMVATLDAALGRLSTTARVAAVGPCHRDPREREDAHFVQIRFPFNRKLRCGSGEGAIGCDFLITSGSLIPLSALAQVGDMDPGLFIDNVDLEWCFRAASLGYALFGVCAAHMRHHHGAERRRVPGLPRGIIVHPPQRLYYMMRNRVLLYRRGYTPRRWIGQDLPRLLVKLLVFSLWVPPRLANLRQMLAGLRAGMAGRTDPPTLRDRDRSG
jgi:rhamnosyltransferase